jgi:hypothetical protein
MNDKALTKLWTVLGLASLLFGWAAAARSRGLSAKSGVVIDVGSLLPDASSILSFVVLAALILLNLYVTRQFAARYPDHSWVRRIPIAYFDSGDVDVTQPLGRLYQKFMLFGFLVLPTVFLVVVFNAFVEASVFDSAGTKLVSGWGQLIRIGGIDWADAFQGRYRFAQPNGPSYYPIVQPWVYLGLALYVVWSTAVTLKSVIRRP